MKTIVKLNNELDKIKNYASELPQLPWTLVEDFAKQVQNVVDSIESVSLGDFVGMLSKKYLEESYELINIGQGDSLSDSSLQAYMNGSDKFWDDEMTDWEDDALEEGARYEWNYIESKCEAEYDALDNPSFTFYDVEELLTQEIKDCDESNWVSDLCRNTNTYFLSIPGTDERTCPEDTYKFYSGGCEGKVIEEFAKYGIVLNPGEMDEVVCAVEDRWATLMFVFKANAHDLLSSDSEMITVSALPWLGTSLNGDGAFLENLHEVTVPKASVFVDSQVSYGAVETAGLSLAVTEVISGLCRTY